MRSLFQWGKEKNAYDSLLKKTLTKFKSIGLDEEEV